MRRFNFLLCPAMLAMVLVTSAADGQRALTFVGEWYGDLEIRPQRGSRNLSDRLNVRKLPTSLEITRAADGTYTVKQISISQNNALIPVTAVTVEGDTIRWSAPAVNGSYEGRLSRNGNEIRGRWTQDGSTNPLNFERVGPKLE